MKGNRMKTLVMAAASPAAVMELTLSFMKTKMRYQNKAA